jgi:amino acid transporter
MSDVSNKAAVILAESKKLKRELTLLPLFGMIYFTVCGGAFGSEAIVGLSGPGIALLLLLLTPLLFSIPNMLMVRELGSMMPAEGGYYHWVKQAFGPFAGFITGWMNLVVSWVDVSIYPVLAAAYLGYFIPALSDGLQIGGTEISADTLSWIVGIILIWLITILQMRGARLAGLTTNWMGLVMLIPLAIISVLGIYNWIASGTTISLPFLTGGQEVNFSSLTSALSVGLFVAMWNYMGWELPTSAGDEIVNPKRTYPLAMVLVLVAAIASYALPMLAGLYGGAGADGQYQMWGIEENETGAGIGAVLEESGITPEQVDRWGVDPTTNYGWEYPDIAHRIGVAFSGEDGNLATFLGSIVTISAVLSMIGLFIGNGLGASRVPFALAQDGMMPSWLVKVHPKYGTPWVSIIIAGVIFTILSQKAFAFLVVVDVFLNCMALLMQFFSLWVLRFKYPDVPRNKIPGGWVGLTLVTLAPLAVITIAVVSQVVDEGLSSLWLALSAILFGAVLYFVMRKFVKPGIPDIDPWHAEPETEE